MLVGMNYEKRTLNLKKVTQGHYQIESADIAINIACPFSQNSGMVAGCSKEWHLTIKRGEEVAYDFWHATKKEAVEAGTLWVLENL